MSSIDPRQMREEYRRLCDEENVLRNAIDAERNANNTAPMTEAIVNYGDWMANNSEEREQLKDFFDTVGLNNDGPFFTLDSLRSVEFEGVTYYFQP